MQLSLQSVPGTLWVQLGTPVSKVCRRNFGGGLYERTGEFGQRQHDRKSTWDAQMCKTSAPTTP